MFLLLPLLLIWARTPMRFGRRLQYSCTAAILGISFAAPPASISLAADGFGDTPAAFSSLPLGGDADATQPDGAPRANVRRLREGTQLDGLTGRFIMVGRRWAFVPDAASSFPDPPVPLATAAQSRTSTTSTYVEQTQIGSRSISVTSTTTQSNTAPNPAAEATAPVPMSLPQMLVAENLMLQRIAEAIRLDPADDRWTISGEVMEFFDENGVRIRTAQRAAMAK